MVRGEVERRYGPAELPTPPFVTIHSLFEGHRCPQYYPAPSSTPIPLSSTFPSSPLIHRLRLGGLLACTAMLLGMARFGFDFRDGSAVCCAQATVRKKKRRFSVLRTVRRGMMGTAHAATVRFYFLHLLLSAACAVVCCICSYI